MTATIGAALLLTSLFSPAEVPWCGLTRNTAYVRTEGNAHTYDGTSIWTHEAIVAASWDVAMGSWVDIDGLGTFRVADRGRLGNGDPMPWIDIAVWDRPTAYALTGTRWACFRVPRY